MHDVIGRTNRIALIIQRSIDGRLFNVTYEQFRKCNVVKAMVCGSPEQLQMWKSKDPDDRMVPGLFLVNPSPGLSAEKFETLVKEHTIQVFGEVAPYYNQGTVNDPGWQPYLEVCEEYDVPVFVHTGAGRTDFNARLRFGDPYLTEDVLVRHPKLRVVLCHSGQEWHEHALVLMCLYPQMYSDLSAVLWMHRTCMRFGREFLAKAKTAGVLDRVMFGTDAGNHPQPVVEMSIECLDSCSFLSEEEKRDILYNNAARFLRCDE